MRAMQVADRITAEEFIAAPETKYGRLANLVDGEVIANDPRLPHQRTLRAIDRVLDQWVEAKPGRGLVSHSIDVEIDARNVFKPDLLWYSAKRVPSDEQDGGYPMPDIVIEIRSPLTWQYDVGAKRTGYERNGLQELWLVDTESESILVYRRSTPSSPTFDVALELAGGETLSSPQLPGFELPIDTVFADR